MNPKIKQFGIITETPDGQLSFTDFHVANVPTGTDGK